MLARGSSHTLQVLQALGIKTVLRAVYKTVDLENSTFLISADLHGFQRLYAYVVKRFLFWGLALSSKNWCVRSSHERKLDSPARAGGLLILYSRAARKKCGHHATASPTG